MRNDAEGGAPRQAAPGGPASSATPRIRKGLMVRVQIYVEGEDEAANDFSKVGQAVVSQVVAAGIKGYTGPYTIAVQKMEPLEGSDGSDEG
jgi:hypothetical protein